MQQGGRKCKWEIILWHNIQNSKACLFFKIPKLLLFSCRHVSKLFFSSTFNSKEIINASLQMHQKKCCFLFSKITQRDRYLKSWFWELESWKVIKLVTWPIILKISSSNSKLVDQSGSRILSPALWLVNQRQQIHGGNFKLIGHVTSSVS